MEFPLTPRGSSGARMLAPLPAKGNQGSSEARDTATARLDRLEWELGVLKSNLGPTPSSFLPPFRPSAPLPQDKQPSIQQTSQDMPYQDLVVAHAELIKSHNALTQMLAQVLSSGARPPVPAPTAAVPIMPMTPMQQMSTPNGGVIGIIRLDGASYTTSKKSKKSVLGDAASKATWQSAGNEVFYQRPEGYTFSVCQFGFIDKDAIRPVFEKEGVVKIKGHEGDPSHMFIPNRRGGPKDRPRPRRPTRKEPWIENGKVIGVQYIYDSDTMLNNLRQCIAELERDCKVDCITAACGFMANVQKVCAESAKVPVLTSSLNLLPIIDMMTSKDDIILVLTANSDSFKANYDELIKPSWGIAKSRLELVGLQNVDGFGDEVAAGTTVDVDVAEENICQAVQAKIQSLQSMRLHVGTILSECTELPGYTNTLRSRFNMPVFDAVTAANVLLNGLIPRDEYENEASYG